MLVLLSILLLTVNPELEDSPRKNLHKIQVDFSEHAIGIESGEPTFSHEMKVSVSNPYELDIKIFVDGNEKSMQLGKLELSDLSPGAHTILILHAEHSEEQRTIGFSIRS
ncbi:MAG: hypothetical protein AAF616_14325 [Bacteroidota bacterium]